MRCRKVRRLLGPYLEGELDREVASKIRGHLESCERCGHELALEKIIMKGMEAYTVPPVPEGFAEEVVRTFEERRAEEVALESIPDLSMFLCRVILCNIKWTVELLRTRFRLTLWATAESFIYTWRALRQMVEVTVEAVRLAYGPSAV